MHINELRIKNDHNCCINVPLCRYDFCGNYLKGKVLKILNGIEKYKIMPKHLAITLFNF